MNNYKSMSYYLNKWSDLIKTKFYVDKGPLEDIKPEPKVKTESNNVGDNSKSKKTSSMSQFLLSNETGNKAISNQVNIVDINSLSTAESSSSGAVMVTATNSTKANVTMTSNIISGEEKCKDFMKEFDLLLSEVIREQEECLLRIEDNEYPCFVIISDYRIIVKPIKYGQVPNLCHYPRDYFDMPLFFIANIDKTVDKKIIGKYMMEITSKDNRIIRLLVNMESKKLYGTLCTLIKPRDISGYAYFAAKYRECHPCNVDGWVIYDPMKEFLRQGVSLSMTEEGKLRLSEVNTKYELCSTYPELLFVPLSITDDELKDSGSFRTKNRLPVLCYFNKTNSASIWRSSQTKSGLTYQRNSNDEKLLKAITDVSENPNRLLIFDARSYSSAHANRFKGAGFENIDNYPGSDIIFCDIDNIHTARNALAKMSLLVTSPQFLENKKFLATLEQTGWNDFLYQIIKGAVHIANSVKVGYSILVHCSDGWDRSSQLTALSQILIDPYYRTIEGFIVLIEKEFLSFGHMFGNRSGFYGPKDFSEDQRSPVFLQWLDCIHQLLVQFPQYFEFNMDLLLFISYHLSSCKYGTFIFNCEKERENSHAKEKSISIWTDVYEYGNYFVNPYYDPSNASTTFILPNFSFHKIRFWEEYFLRYVQFNPNMNTLYENPKHLPAKHFSSNLEFKKIIANPPKIKTISNVQYAELEKKKDAAIIEQQNEEIEELTEILKEISSKIVLKVSDFNTLSEEAKNYLKDSQNGEFVEEDGYVVIKSSSDK